MTLPDWIYAHDREALTKMTLEYECTTPDGSSILVYSVRGTYEGWRMITIASLTAPRGPVESRMGYACSVVRFRDGGTTRVASTLGELYVPSTSPPNRQATFHPRDQGDGRLLDRIPVSDPRSHCHRVVR